MSTNSTETIVTVALTTALTVSVRSAAAFQSVMSNDAAPAATVHLLVRINGTLDDADVDRTRATARALLASAGIHTDWRECRSPGPCNADPMGTIPLVVELLPASKPGGEDVCGEVVRHRSREWPQS